MIATRAFMKTRTLDEFYQAVATSGHRNLEAFLPPGISKEIGHFNVFSIHEVFQTFRETGQVAMPYNRRSYYKISFIQGHNRAEYADKTIEIESSALLFATPKIPYHWLPQDLEQAGYFCVFTEEFLLATQGGVVLDELPIFQAGAYPVFQLSEEESVLIELIFKKMHQELASDYVYKYDLIRAYLLELIHRGQKLQPLTAARHTSTARTSSLFVELLERQFPIESPHQPLPLRTAKDFADRLSIHVNSLNRALKTTTGKTTTDLISQRLIQEAKRLLKHTDWNISEIAYGLGFEEVAHFSNFFRKQTSWSPISFRK